MRTHRLMKKKRKKKIFLLATMSLLLLFLSVILFQDTYSKGATKTNDPVETEMSAPTPIVKDQTNSEDDSTPSDPKGDSNDIPQEKSEDQTNQNQSPENQPVKDKEDIDPAKQEDEPTPNETGEKVIYLTFDDGPASFTTEILDLLEKYNAKATFFMLQPSMKRYPEAIVEMVKRGHQVGLHSVTHDKNKFYASKNSVLSEMGLSQETLESISGVKTPLIRTPYGSVPHMKPEYIRAVNEAGFVMWDWNIDSLDWKLTDGSFVKNTIQQIENFSKNEPMVVLLHDRQTTLNHLEKLLTYLSTNGYVMKALEWDMKPVQFNH